MHDPIPIKVAMVRQRVNGMQLAEKAGVSRPTVSRIVNGKRVMPDKLEAVLGVLDLRMADIYDPKPEAQTAAV
ncbi:MAG: Cro/C1-type DNA-binding domain [Acidobacteriota bacterium]|jgi:transcriptional regulator with XRE-family HTH domain|nr:Cro/C1-type DNA-binding domain [Acidobacteriota bacterium]